PCARPGPRTRTAPCQPHGRGRWPTSDATDRRNRLQPRRDVDALAVDIVTLDDDVAEINADAVADALFRGALLFGMTRRFLDRERAIDSRWDRFSKERLPGTRLRSERESGMAPKAHARELAQGIARDR